MELLPGKICHAVLSKGSLSFGPICRLVAHLEIERSSLHCTAARVLLQQRIIQAGQPLQLLWRVPAALIRLQLPRCPQPLVIFVVVGV